MKAAPRTLEQLRLEVRDALRRGIPLVDLVVRCHTWMSVMETAQRERCHEYVEALYDVSATQYAHRRKVGR